MKVSFLKTSCHLSLSVVLFVQQRVIALRRNRLMTKGRMIFLSGRMTCLSRFEIIVCLECPGIRSAFCCVSSVFEASANAAILCPKILTSSHEQILP